MPRKPRMYLLGITSHGVQRGNDRNPCLFDEENYWFWKYKRDVQVLNLEWST
jgi:hypothetical protein